MRRAKYQTLTEVMLLATSSRHQRGGEQRMNGSEWSLCLPVTCRHYGQWQGWGHHVIRVTGCHSLYLSNRAAYNEVSHRHSKDLFYCRNNLALSAALAAS